MKTVMVIVFWSLLALGLLNISHVLAKNKPATRMMAEEKHTEFLTKQVVNVLTTCGVDKSSLTLPDHMDSVHDLMQMIYAHIIHLPSVSPNDDPVYAPLDRLHKRLRGFVIGHEEKSLLELSFQRCYVIRNTQYQIKLANEILTVFDDFIEKLKLQKWNTVTPSIQSVERINRKSKLERRFRKLKRMKSDSSNEEFQQLSGKVMKLLNEMKLLKAQKKHRLSTIANRKTVNYYYGYGVPDQPSADPDVDTNDEDVVDDDEENEVVLEIRKKRSLNNDIKANYNDLVIGNSREVSQTVEASFSSVIQEESLVMEHISQADGMQAILSVDQTETIQIGNTSPQPYSSEKCNNKLGKCASSMEGKVIMPVDVKVFMSPQSTRLPNTDTDTIRKYHIFMVEEISKSSDKEPINQQLVQNLSLNRLKRSSDKTKRWYKSREGETEGKLTHFRKRRSDKIGGSDDIEGYTERNARRHDRAAESDTRVRVEESKPVELICLQSSKKSLTSSQTFWSVNRGLGFVPVQISESHYSVSKNGNLNLARAEARDMAVFQCEVAGADGTGNVVKKKVIRELTVWRYPNYLIEVRFYFNIKSCKDHRAVIKEEEVRTNLEDFVGGTPYSYIQDMRTQCTAVNSLDHLIIKLNIVLKNTYQRPECNPKCARDDAFSKLDEVFEQVDSYAHTEGSGLFASEVDRSFAVINRDMLHKKFDEHCTPGYYKSDLVCVPCSIGHFTTNATSDRGLCQKCTVNTYQHEFAQVFCHTCPDGTSTSKTGANDISQCAPKNQMRSAVIKEIETKDETEKEIEKETGKETEKEAEKETETEKETEKEIEKEIEKEDGKEKETEDEKEKEKKHLRIGIVIFASFGILILIIIVGLVVICLLKKRSTKEGDPESGNRKRKMSRGQRQMYDDEASDITPLLPGSIPRPPPPPPIRQSSGGGSPPMPTGPPPRRPRKTLGAPPRPPRRTTDAPLPPPGKIPIPPPPPPIPERLRI